MEYLFAAGLLAAMTVTPLPMPPTWLVLTYLSVELGGAPAGMILAGAAGATAGRVCLVLWTRALGPRLLDRDGRENVGYLADHLHGRRTTLGVAGVLAVSPPPSGALYTAAGVLRINVALVAVSCFAGRLVTYSAGVLLVGGAAEELADRLRGSIGPVSALVGVAAVALALWLLARIDWRALLERRRLRLRPRRPRVAR